MRPHEDYLLDVGYVQWTILGLTEAVRKLVPSSVWVCVWDDPKNKPFEVMVSLDEPRWRRWCWWLARRDKKRVEVVLEFSRPPQLVLHVEIGTK